MQLDMHFMIGAVHSQNCKPCQDYVLGAIRDKAGYLVLSDGCSGGGRTEVGASLVCLSTEHVLKQHMNRSPDIQVIHSQQIAEQRNMQQALHLGDDDMMASRIYALVNENEGIIHVLGDGAVALRFASGVTRLYSFNWNREIVYYPAYEIGGTQNFVNSHNVPLPYTIETDLHLPGAGFVDGRKLEWDIKKGMAGAVIYLDKQTLEQLQFIAVFTDGVKSLTHISWKEFVMDLINFKSLASDFVSRRLKRAIRDLNMGGTPPDDDIGYACFYFPTAKANAKQAAAIKAHETAENDVLHFQQTTDQKKRLVEQAESEVAKATDNLHKAKANLESCNKDLTELREQRRTEAATQVAKRKIKGKKKERSFFRKLFAKTAADTKPENGSVKASSGATTAKSAVNLAKQNVESAAQALKAAEEALANSNSRLEKAKAELRHVVDNSVDESQLVKATNDVIETHNIYVLCP